MNDDPGLIFLGVVTASLLWLAFVANDNDVLARHYKAAEVKCETNDGVEQLEGNAFFSRYSFTITCNNGAEFIIPWREKIWINQNRN